MDKIKLYLGIIVGTVIAVLLAIIGFQKQSAEKKEVVAIKQEQLIKIKDENFKKAAQVYEVKEELHEKQEEVKKEEEENIEKINETETVQDAIDAGNNLVDQFNKRRVPNRRNPKHTSD